MDLSVSDSSAWLFFPITAFSSVTLYDKKKQKDTQSEHILFLLQKLWFKKLMKEMDSTAERTADCSDFAVCVSGEFRLIY